MIILDESNRQPHEVPQHFKIGDSVRLLTLEELPSRHTTKDTFFAPTYTNPYKMAFLGQEMTISDVYFAQALGEWVYQTEEDDNNWSWFGDMFVHTPSVVPEKGQSVPQMPNL